MRNYAHTGKRLRRAVAVILAMSALGVTSNVLADTDKEKALEARVAELEKMVNQLVAQQQAMAAGAPAAAAPDKPIQATTVTPGAAPGTTFNYGGFVKADFLFSDYGDGATTGGRDFYVPGATPVGGESEDVYFDAHAKQTRIHFGTNTVLDSGKNVKTYIEMDFYGSGSGNERVSNTYSPVLRHAFVQYNGWLVGQTWSNFMNPAALPEAVDFIGPTDGSIFVRQTQARYTIGGLSLAIENPETTLLPYEGGTSFTTDDSSWPDFTGRYTLSGDWGQVAIAGLVRELKYVDNASNIDDSKWTGALSLTGLWKIFSKDDIRWMLSGGNLGRYNGLNFATEGVLSSSGKIETIDGWAGYLAYRHFWTDKMRSTFFYSMQDYDNPRKYTGSAVNKSSDSIGVNFFYSPIPKLDVGVAYRHATRELENGSDGDLDRVQFTTKYSF